MIMVMMMGGHYFIERRYFCNNYSNDDEGYVENGTLSTKNTSIDDGGHNKTRH
jgi:hypothetical protein